MARVITFSRVFPKYHPEAGQPTYFVEQIYNSLFSKNNLMDYPKGLDVDDRIMGVKKHTVRNGNRWKVGDKFSPRVWSGKPYNSKQIILCEDLEVKNIYDFEIKIIEVDGIISTAFFINNVMVSINMLVEVAGNDGLSFSDFLEWFQYPKPFKGQIICWCDVFYKY